MVKQLVNGYNLGRSHIVPVSIRYRKPDILPVVSNVQWDTSLRPRQRRHAHRSRSRFDQCPAASPRRGSSRKNVIHQQHMPSAHPFGIGDKKSAAQIQAALAGSQPRLTLRRSLPHKRTRRQLQPPLRMAFPEDAQSLRRQRARLVKPALRHPRAVQRHRDNQHVLRSVRSHLCNRIRKPQAKFSRHGSHAVVFQRMNGPAHRALVNPITDDTDKRRRRHPARPAVARH
jgi:hypothetical protein